MLSSFGASNQQLTYRDDNENDIYGQNLKNLAASLSSVTAKNIDIDGSDDNSLSFRPFSTPHIRRTYLKQCYRGDDNNSLLLRTPIVDNQHHWSKWSDSSAPLTTKTIFSESEISNNYNTPLPIPDNSNLATAINTFSSKKLDIYSSVSLPPLDLPALSSPIGSNSSPTRPFSSHRMIYTAGLLLPSSPLQRKNTTNIDALSEY